MLFSTHCVEERTISHRLLAHKNSALNITNKHAEALENKFRLMDASSG